MSLIEELADAPCERSTTRHGCLGANLEEQCNPCRARVELGRPTEVPRRCAHCGALLVSVVVVDGERMGTDAEGSTFCAAPKHRVKLFYDEYPKL